MWMADIKTRLDEEYATVYPMLKYETLKFKLGFLVSNHLHINNEQYKFCLILNL